MDSSYYPFAEFFNCDPDSPTDRFPTQIFRYSRALYVLVAEGLQFRIDTDEYCDIEDKRFVWFRDNHAALTRVTGIGCNVVDHILDTGEIARGWSSEGVPLLTGVAVQIAKIASPDYLRSREPLLKSSDLIETRLNQPSLEVIVYDARDCGRLSMTVLRNKSLMAALGVPMMRYDLHRIRVAASSLPPVTTQIEERMQLVAEQRERAVNESTWMLAAGNFGSLSLRKVRNSLIDLALDLPEKTEAAKVLDLALNGMRDEIIAISERVAGPLG